MNTPKSGVKTSGARTAASDDREAMTPCTMPCRFSSTVLADIAVRVGGTRSVSAASGRSSATIQIASAKPNPTRDTTPSTSPQTASRASPSRATAKGITPACTMAISTP